jgi:hypothetical protein
MQDEQVSDGREDEAPRPKEVTIGKITYRAASWSKQECEQRLTSAVRLLVQLAIEAAKEEATQASGTGAPDNEENGALGEIEKLPDEITAKIYAQYAKCSTRAVTKMIRHNLLPFRVVNPNAKRPKYAIPTWALRRQLGLPYSKF